MSDRIDYELVDAIHAVLGGANDWITLAGLDELLRLDIERIEARMEAREERHAIALEVSCWPYSLVADSTKTPVECALTVLQHPEEFPAYQRIAKSFLKQCGSHRGIFKRGIA